MSSDQFELSSGSFRQKPRFCTPRWIVFWAVLTAAACIGLGVIIGYFSHSSSSDPVPNCPAVDPGETPGITEKILAQISASNIKEYLRRFTLYPHMSGTPGEDMLANELMDEWRLQGLDHVTSVTYNVLLSYPNTSDPNMIYLVDESGGVQYKTQEVEAIVRDDQNHTDVIPPFNAYSPSGDVEGDLVYVNYGRVEDFKLLVSNYNVSVTGKIVIVRYGQIFRGDKVENAHTYGAIAVIIYSDPADYSIADNDEGVYPESWWLPGTGVQRGTIQKDNGDPLTPGYPSTETAYRRAEEDAELPTIPCHPIGYDDAQQFLSRLGGDEVPEAWRGRLNITYRFGPGFDGDSQNWTVKMHVSTHTRRVNTSDVFGYITGAVEPDRYVLLGNHRDAWVFGAIDPTSSTALMMEVSRVLAKLVKEGWRPRRTIIFCSWGSEEPGLVGSYEFVEGNIKNIGHRVVSYLNVDLSVEGQVSMRAKGVPLLYDLLYDVAKKIPAANNPSITLFDEWLKTFPQSGNPSLPVIKDLGSGSDHAAFIGIAGVPCLDVRYTHNYPIIDYPLYHSVYETFHLFDEILDKEYKYSRAIGQYWAEAARYLADSTLIPFNASQYGETLKVFVSDLKKGYGELMENNGILLGQLDEAAERFHDECNKFMRRLPTADKSNPLEIRMLNDQLMQLERAFTTSEGLPGRPLHKHILFAPSAFDSYAGVTFPGLVDLMWEIEDRVEEDADRQWDLVRQHLAAVIYSVDSATSSLKPVTLFN